MKTPFKNEPFAITWQAFKNLYPDKDCECWFEPELKDEDGEPACGLTAFRDDGSLIVFVDPNLTMENATEVFAHELAHVAAGYEHGHDGVWESVFDKILEEYDKLGKEIVSSN